MAIVSHHEIHSRWNHQVAILDVVRKVNGPFFRGPIPRIARGSIRRHGREFVQKVSVVFRRCWLGAWLVLYHSVDEDDAVEQTLAVARNTD